MGASKNDTKILLIQGVEYKDCFDCKQLLAIDQFGSNGFHKGRRRYKPRCTKCETLYGRSTFYTKVFDLIGGVHNFKCARCGYSKYFGALEFHHLDPSTKDRNISKMQNYSKELIAKEMEKCIILCSNCHREEHGKLGLEFLWLDTHK